MTFETWVRVLLVAIGIIAFGSLWYMVYTDTKDRQDD